MATPRRKALVGLPMLALLATGIAACGSDVAPSAVAPTTAPGEPATPRVESGAPSGSGSPTASVKGEVNPADFQPAVDNPYLPLAPGTRWRYRATTEDGSQDVVLEVTEQRRPILGVPTTVVRDTVSEDGEVVETTTEWYAQDRQGNVWYFGGASKEYEGGKVLSTAGSWEAGKKGARAGIVMKGQPQVGDKYAQGYPDGKAADMAEVVSVTEEVKLRNRSYRQVLLTRETTPAEPGVVEQKHYARGVGLILETTVKGGKDKLELVDKSGP
jgi:hypothetical protein